MYKTQHNKLVPLPLSKIRGTNFSFLKNGNFITSQEDRYYKVYSLPNMHLCNRYSRPSYFAGESSGSYFIILNDINDDMTAYVNNLIWYSKKPPKIIYFTSRIKTTIIEYWFRIFCIAMNATHRLPTDIIDIIAHSYLNQRDQLAQLVICPSKSLWKKLKASKQLYTQKDALAYK